MRPFLLNNKKGQALEATKPVIMSYRFLRSLFQIEENFEDKDEKFYFRTNGKGRLLYHITKADLQLLTTLQVCINTQGNLDFVNRHMIYLKLEELYEAPCSKDQFYAAFEKFVLLGLISIQKEDISGHHLVKLNHYLEPDTDRIGRFIVFHPIVFSKQFTSKPIAVQKLFYHALAQQGSDRKKQLQWNLDDMKDFLHKREIYQVRLVLDDLTRIFCDEKPLFYHADIERSSYGGYKAVYQVHMSWILDHTPKNEYREVLKAKKGYRRIFNTVGDLLTEYGISELQSYRDGFCFKQLIHLLKKKSISYIRYVLSRVKDLYVNHKFLPVDLIDFIKRELRTKALSVILTMAQQTRVYDFISPELPNVKERRMFEFASSLSVFDTKTIRRAFKWAAPILHNEYTVPPVTTAHDYRECGELDQYLDMNRIRLYAYDLEKDPQSYHQLEHRLKYKLFYEAHSDHEIKELESWMLQEIEALPNWSRVPNIPNGFKLEDWIVQCIEQFKFDSPQPQL